MNKPLALEMKLLSP